MSEKATIKAELRTETGKSANRKLRSKGLVPAVFYTQKGENMILTVNENEFAKMFRQTGTTRVFSLEVDGKAYDTLAWKVQKDPVRPRVNHIDFLGVTPGSAIKLDVPVVTTGRAPGVKLGGRIAVYRSKLTVACTAETLPASISVDVSSLNVGDTVFVNEIDLGEGASVVFDNNFALVRCAAGRGAAKDEEEDKE
ncbi:50S ribosomal protein L25 [Maridesulfovibrio sp.]|uniref:50S ribosomal protein L25 n=1 Tax=Maridesulfovibrio sp. TaxID=2795000 RepID=UPI002A188342|nr:50S ribosomal protein L25 [Maridesulfovibrio sp.]